MPPLRSLAAAIGLSFALVPAATAPAAPAERAAPSCAGLTPTHLGTAAGETLRGTNGRDVIQGLGGNDTIYGRGGNDVICGGAGADVLGGGSGNDTLLGGIGADALDGGAGADSLDGGSAADICRRGEVYDSCLLGLRLTEVARLPGGSAAGIIAAPPGDARLFVVDQGGPIYVIVGGALRATPFLDLTGIAGPATGEQGVLGLAFSPDYATDGLFYVNYTDLLGDTVVAEYSVSANPNIADPNSAGVLLRIDQPAANHNGGMLAFGPDGMLYVGTGDGGGSGDPQETGQNASDLLGSLLRIDPDGMPYAVPPDNPFVGVPGADEVWAYGLRNPWRFAFDAGRLYVADVGQGRREEIDVAPASAAGLNYGWDTLEGSLCFEPAADCSAAGTVLPVLEYDNPPTGCVAVIGGYVYRGSLLPELAGHYLYGDYCGGWVRSFRYTTAGPTNQVQWITGVGGLTSFGRGADNEIYLATDAGVVYRLTAIR